MGLIDRLIHGAPEQEPERASLAADARSMREALDAYRREVGASRADVRGALRDMLSGEMAAPTADVARLRERGTDADDFYTREIAPSWDGRNEAQRAARLDGFLEMCSLLESAGTAAGLPEDMAMNVRTKTLLLAWAFDEEYGYLSRLGRDQALAD